PLRGRCRAGSSAPGNPLNPGICGSFAAAQAKLRDMRRLLAALVIILTGLSVISAQRLGFSAEEFTARRQALAKAIGSGTVLLAGRTLPLSGIRFRQDNDFFYLTGNEDTNAVLAIDAPSGDSWLFLPP